MPFTPGRGTWSGFSHKPRIMQAEIAQNPNYVTCPNRFLCWLE
ncbi:MAG: hypothetical protein P8N97_05700 [Alphaproteobacteria bacterium]|nr:hypothetical protein [Alphaproteobacteria bacterium]